MAITAYPDAKTTTAANRIKLAVPPCLMDFAGDTVAERIDTGLASVDTALDGAGVLWLEPHVALGDPTVVKNSIIWDWRGKWPLPGWQPSVCVGAGTSRNAAIVAATNATPIHLRWVKTPEANIASGTYVSVVGVGGNTNANSNSLSTAGQFLRVTNVTSTTISGVDYQEGDLQYWNPGTSAWVDRAGSGAYTSGGTLYTANEDATIRVVKAVAEPQISNSMIAVHGLTNINLKGDGAVSFPVPETVEGGVFVGATYHEILTPCEPYVVGCEGVAIVSSTGGSVNPRSYTGSLVLGTASEGPTGIGRGAVYYAQSVISGGANIGAVGEVFGLYAEPPNIPGRDLNTVAGASRADASIGFYGSLLIDAQYGGSDFKVRLDDTYNTVMPFIQVSSGDGVHAVNIRMLQDDRGVVFQDARKQNGGGTDWLAAEDVLRIKAAQVEIGKTLVAFDDAGAHIGYTRLSRSQGSYLYPDVASDGVALVLGDVLSSPNVVAILTGAAFEVRRGDNALWLSVNNTTIDCEKSVTAPDLATGHVVVSRSEGSYAYPDIWGSTGGMAIASTSAGASSITLTTRAAVQMSGNERLAVNADGGVQLTGISAPGGVSGSGVIWFDSQSNKLRAKENNNSAVDLITAAGVTSVNSATGALTIAGTSNRVTVSTSGTTITFSGPQDLATSSDVVFGSVRADSGYKMADSGSTVRTLISNSSDTLLIRPLNDSNGITVRNIAGSAEWAKFTGNGIGTDGSYYVTGTKVVGSRITGWTTPSGTPNRSGFTASSVLEQHVLAIINDLKAHGLFGA